MTVFLYMSELNKRMFNTISSSKIFNETSVLNMSLRIFCLFPVKNGEGKKKWSVTSVSEP